ncbi:unnamed protein product [Polarella glacialis]|uniref:Uncharacterized protein n=1 Tax=Polarella glacialis TaxID=89957 RepID=A0A813J296_POLGL|nr:unnamed protein product [Polarella glacialis]
MASCLAFALVNAIHWSVVRWLQKRVRSTNLEARTSMLTSMDGKLSSCSYQVRRNKCFRHAGCPEENVDFSASNEQGALQLPCHGFDVRVEDLLKLVRVQIIGECMICEPLVSMRSPKTRTELPCTA